MRGFRIGYYSGEPTKLPFDCRALQPALFPSVPRLYNRFYGVITEKFDSAGGCKGWLAKKAVASKKAAVKSSGKYTSGCWDKIVFKKSAAVLGGKVKYLITASAPIDKNVLEMLKIAFCCPMVEGYGLTETSGGSSFTALVDPVLGHVGGPTKAIKWRLMDLPESNYLHTDTPYPRGELCMKGPAVFSGYYKREDKTAEAFDADGWFKTGDVAMLYPNGSVKIIDRSKNIFKLSQGEYIAPEKVENIFALSPYVAQSILYGDSLQSCTVCIVVPNPDKVKEWENANKKEEDAGYTDPVFKKLVQDDLEQLGKAQKLSGLERPKDIFLEKIPFSVENNLLTPTFKLKRNIAKVHYKD